MTALDSINRIMNGGWDIVLTTVEDANRRQLGTHRAAATKRIRGVPGDGDIDAIITIPIYASDLITALDTLAQRTAHYDLTREVIAS